MFNKFTRADNESKVQGYHYYPQHNNNKIEQVKNQKSTIIQNPKDFYIHNKTKQTKRKENNQQVCIVNHFKKHLILYF